MIFNVCRLCGSGRLRLAKRANRQGGIISQSFCVTESRHNIPEIFFDEKHVDSNSVLDWFGGALYESLQEKEFEQTTEHRAR